MDPPLSVYVWDMDETLILFKSLLTGDYAEAFRGSKDVQEGVEIASMWEKHILQICHEHFFYQQIENYNQPFLNALSQFDDEEDLSVYDFKQDELGDPNDDVNKRKLAYRHRVIAQNYKQGLHNLLDKETIELWNELYDTTDKYTDKWLSSARALLMETSRGKKAGPSDGTIVSNDMEMEYVNVLVTSGSLIPSLVKCMLFRLDDTFSHENVYSSSEVGKLQCFQWIKERFNRPNVQFNAIGDGCEERAAAKTMEWSFVKINFRPANPYRFPGLTLRSLRHYLIMGDDGCYFFRE